MEAAVDCEGYDVLCDRHIDLKNVTAMTKSLIRYPKAWAVSMSLVTLLAGAVSIILADLGGPAWVFIVLGFWLWTIGLPTTAAVLLLIALWREPAVSVSSSLGFFVVCAMILSLCFQTSSVLFVVLIFKSMGKARR